MDNKRTVAVIFGGQSSEHGISCMSVQTIIKALDPEKYHILPVGITKDGHWLLVPSLGSIEKDTWREEGTAAVLSPDARDHGLIVKEDGGYRTVRVDVIFPVLHGMYGEDGTIQGLFEMSCIPYVGCGVLSSSVSMDKVYTKYLVDRLGIRQADYVVVESRDVAKQIGACADRVEEKLSYPVFVKPSRAGSSKGVSKASDRQELYAAMKEASGHDHWMLVEEAIDGREIECAVLGGRLAQASDVGEVLSADEFYDYESKYFNAESKTDLHPVFPEGKLEEVRRDALAIFKIVDGFGCARVDFFMEKETNEIVFNEINTMPGFTAISMYPMLWKEQGVDTPELVDRLICLAFERAQEQEARKC